jgi:hypothetical protein
VDGDGTPEALVGVVKSTRYYPEKGRRLFIFHLVRGKVRPLWLGSKVGGPLVDFRFVDGRVRTLEQAPHDRYSVAEWQWKDFGLQFQRYLVEKTTLHNAREVFDNKDNKDN